MLDAVCDEPIDYSEEGLEGLPKYRKIQQIPEIALCAGAALPA